MEYRAIRSEEVPRWRQFQEYCFQVSPVEFDPWMARKFQIQHTRSLYADDGQMVATCSNYPLHLLIEGERIAMGGIASVASLPESRRGGHVGALLGHLIREMKEQAIPISGLFPFNEAFYRRYGWDVASSWAEHEIPIGLLGRYRKYDGLIRRHLPGEGDWRELAPIYAQWAAKRCGYMVRESEYHWQNWVYSPMPSGQLHTAVYRPTAGAEPEGYLLYRFDKPSQGWPQLLVREMVALTVAAEQALWGFLANHDSQAGSVKVRTPRTYPVWHLVESTLDLKSTLHAGWQLRLIDLKGAFEGRPWAPEANGSTIIAVVDEQAPWNAGTWRVTFADGRASVAPAPLEVAALAADIQCWAQLFAGSVRPEQAAGTGRLSVSDERGLRLFSQAMPTSELMFWEFF